MISAFLTSVSWAIAAVFGQRAARHLGSMSANFLRMVVALLILGTCTFWLQPDSLHSATFQWLFWSGLIGYGIGDLGLYLAYARVGSRITILITFCLAPVIAAVAEWLWLGTLLEWPEILGVGAIVLGVSQSLGPSTPETERYGNFSFGIGMAFLSAAGQGIGAVFTRQANQTAAELALTVPALSQAFQRMLPGLLVAGVVWVILRLQGRLSLFGPSGWKSIYHLWILANAGFGPVMGAINYQHDLETTESAIVLAVIAATPIILMPFAYFTEKDRPTPRAIAGALFAVGGLIALGIYRLS